MEHQCWLRKAVWKEVQLLIDHSYHFSHQVIIHTIIHTRSRCCSPHECQRLGMCRGAVKAPDWLGETPLRRKR